MLFSDTPIKGAKIIDLENSADDRGFFARLFCSSEFKASGLINSFVQINNSLSTYPGTLRGMHYQVGEDAEVKVVRCISGSLFDVIVDLRPHSSSYKQWFGVELSDENRKMMYVPQGCAHGFITLEPNTEALYLVSNAYSPTSERGIRYDDPLFSIKWPIAPFELSEKDSTWPDFCEDYHEVKSFKGF